MNTGNHEAQTWVQDGEAMVRVRSQGERGYVLTFSRSDGGGEKYLEIGDGDDLQAVAEMLSDVAEDGDAE